MIWTDGDFCTSADLTTVDSEVALVGQAEEITIDALATGQAPIHRAIEAAGDSIMAHMQQFGGYLSTQSVSANHYAAVMNVGLPAVQRSKVLLSQVVTSTQIPGEWSSLKRWVAYKCLAAFFTDASHRTQLDRYAEKALAYNKYAASVLWQNLVSRGLPIVRTPLPCPGAVYEPGSGSWGASNVSAVTQAGAVGGDWDVAVTWIQQGASTWISPTKKQNGESGPSTIVTKATTAGQALRVSIAGLVPPSGSQPESTVSTALVAYGTATGWFIYAGPTGGPLYLQTPNPLPLATTAYTLPSDPVSGPLVGTGQFPDIFYTFVKTLQRA